MTEHQKIMEEIAGLFKTGQLDVLQLYVLKEINGAYREGFRAGKELGHDNALLWDV